MKTIKPHKKISAAVAVLSDATSMDILLRGDALAFSKSLPDASIDMVFSSPPYCMGKAYEKSSSVDDFIESHRVLIPEIVRITKPGGSICWQVGYHVDRDRLVPLDYLAHDVFRTFGDLKLKNRVVWTFAHGLHARKRFSGRHEVVLWYVKDGSNTFNLDAVRVPQKYPGKRSYRGPRKGELSGNPLGKNPGDVWEIPNVKGFHVEKTDHPCQFPVALPQTFIRAACDKSGLVFDPFMGVGSTGVAAALEGCRFIGSEIVPSYTKEAARRISEARSGHAKYRPLERAIHTPKPTDAVAQKPEHFWKGVA